MSIRRRLLVWLLSSILVAGLLASAVVFYLGRQQANDLFDYQLRQLALTLRDRSFAPNELAEALQERDGLDFVIEVWSSEGRLIYASHPELLLPPAAESGFSDVEGPMGTWRVFSIWHRGVTIEVAQHKLAREAAAFGAALRTLAPFLLVLPLMGWLIWRLVGQEVRVLERTAQAIAKRTPESLDPIGSESVPEEVQPLVTALNGLLLRLGGALSQQRQFIADAAHELRTPLTALRLQLQLAERARDDEERRKAHDMLREGIVRATHVVEQLLTLARADPEATKGERRTVDLANLARSVVLVEEVAAAEKGLSLTFEQATAVPLLVPGDGNALRTLIENLVDNALRYTPAGSVKVRVSGDGDEALLEVQDTGPGIAAQDRERVFDRFYRGEGAAEGGSGLGLSIAKRIAERTGGRVQLLDVPSGTGLLVRVHLPVVKELPAS